jgi:hypothetical protein
MLPTQSSVLILHVRSWSRRVCLAANIYYTWGWRNPTSVTPYTTYKLDDGNEDQSCFPLYLALRRKDYVRRSPSLGFAEGPTRFGTQTFARRWTTSKSRRNLIVLLLAALSGQRATIRGIGAQTRGNSKASSYATSGLRVRVPRPARRPFVRQFLPISVPTLRLHQRFQPAKFPTQSLIDRLTKHATKCSLWICVVFAMQAAFSWLHQN